MKPILLHAVACTMALGPCVAMAEAALTETQQDIEDFLIETGQDLLEPEGFSLQNMAFAEGDADMMISEQRVLEAGNVYAFLAKCEAEACVGISLSLSDEMGHLYTETNRQGEDVYFGFQPETTGTFTFDIEIFACNEAPCDVGFALYRGPGIETEETP